MPPHVLHLLLESDEDEEDSPEPLHAGHESLELLEDPLELEEPLELQELRMKLMLSKMEYDNEE